MPGDRESSAREQLDARLVRVERALDAITREVTAIRAALEVAPASPREPITRAAFVARLTAPAEAPSAPTAPAPAGEPAPPKAQTVRPRRPAENLDLESMVGRYGMLGIAVFAAVAAVGTFLSWAIRNGYLSLPPAARVIVALVFAAGLGAWGIYIRKRERPFGSSVVGLALVIVLVCGYAAGSWLRLVPPWIAFAGCIGVSWGLALFAHAEQDEPLWCVAFGGAALAPFVTSSDEGNFYALVGYGAFLLFAASFAISHRVWSVAWRIFYLVAALYAITATAMSHQEGLPGFYAAFAFPMIIALAGVLPFAPLSRKRAAMRWFAILTVVVGFAAPHGINARANAGQITAALFGAAVLWLIVADRLDATKQSSLLARNGDNTTVLDWIDAGMVPLVLFYQATGAIEPLASPALVEGLGAAVLLLFALRRELRPARDAAAAACAILAVAAVFQLKLEEPTGRLLALLGIAVAALVVNKARPSGSWIAASAVTTVIAASFSLFALVSRPSYTYTPFTGEPSLTAALVTLFLILVARFRGWIADSARPIVAEPSDRADAADLSFVRGLARLAPWAWAFTWVLIELGKAFSRSTSTLLLVIYFAATAVAAVAVGHIRRSPELRQLGLALALLAAATAVYGATTYFDVGARVLAYLVTSAFLLGIAYWYRRRPVESAA
jgi:hypothetical protein